jgi:hypothetical protein
VGEIPTLAAADDPLPKRKPIDVAALRGIVQDQVSSAPEVSALAS